MIISYTLPKLLSMKVEEWCNSNHFKDAAGIIIYATLSLSFFPNRPTRPDQNLRKKRKEGKKEKENPRYREVYKHEGKIE